LKGSTVLVFGGSSGIGKSVAISASAAGAKEVLIVGRNEGRLEEARKEIEAASSRCSVKTASVDVGDEAAVRRFINGLPDNSVDHLVTTPGGSAKLGNLIQNQRTCDDVRRQFDLKFFAQLAPVLAIGSKIKEGGSITMTSGILSRRPGRGNDALAVSNAAIECCVKCLANDFGFDGRRVRVNCLSPGMTLTPTYGDSPQMKMYQQKSAEAAPLQRNALPEEQAHAVLFFMTNTFVTGVVLDVDGGLVSGPGAQKK
jgi:NAD(P)-dependent dehydrogenase (short-subunit alcohol dehydrogenase family)